MPDAIKHYDPQGALLCQDCQLRTAVLLAVYRPGEASVGLCSSCALRSSYLITYLLPLPREAQHGS